MTRLRTVAALAGLGAMLAVATTMAWGQAKPAAPAAAKWELTKEQKDRAAKIKNPVPAADKAASIERGKQLAMNNCAPCHGQSGKGDGPGAAALPKKPADWTSKAVQSESDANLFVRITDGNAPMPPWSSLPDKDRWDLVNYVKSLGKKA
jgi:mono/diheme cytochrome c family protein